MTLMRKDVIFQGNKYLHLWMTDGDRPRFLIGAYIRRIRLTPQKRAFVVIDALFNYPAEVLYPFADGTNLELRYCEFGRQDEYDNGHTVIKFLDCKLLSARQRNVNVGDVRPMCMTLFIECDVLYDLQMKKAEDS